MGHGALRNELSTPPLQKTINSKEDVRSHLFEEHDEPELDAVISAIPLVRTPYSVIFTVCTTVVAKTKSKVVETRCLKSTHQFWRNITFVF